MNRKMADFIILFVWASIVLNASPLHAGWEQNTSSGQSWLIQNKQGNEYWGRSIPADVEIDELTSDDVSPVSFRDSTEAAAVLASYGTYTLDYQVAVEWIAAFNAITTEYLARKISILAAAGSDTSVYLGTLQSYQNKKGCFGGYKNTPCSPLDTALALQALKAANFSDTTVLFQAINFLTINQKSDGGWGFTANDPSNAYVTAMALRALSGYSSQFGVQSSIQSASAYLLTKQNTDGGFASSTGSGQGSSTIYETAFSVMALIESGQGTAQALLNGINYLTTTQLPNGSWNGDPYYTALALQALAKVKPNLSISSLALSKSMPREGEDVTITALIASNGLEDAAGVVVRFFSGDPSSGGVQIGADQIIPSIARSSSFQTSITTSFFGTGAKTIYAVVDPDNLISETNENDNKASARLWVATGPDLAVFSEDLKPSTYVPATSAAFTFEYTVRNLGETEAGQFSVALYDGDPASGGAQLQTAALSGVPGGGSRTGTFGVTLNGNRSHTLYLVADSGSVITEASEANNTGSITVTVGGTMTMADLAASPMDVTLTPARPHAGDTVQINARIRNQGAEAANNFFAEIYDGAPETGGVLIASQMLSLAAGGEQTIKTNWAIPAGIHDVYLVLDRNNQINETNNTARWKRT